MSNTEPLDFSLFGDVIINPSTGQKEDPKKVLVGKIVSGSRSKFSLAQVSSLIFPSFSNLPAAGRSFSTSELIGGNVSDKIHAGSRVIAHSHQEGGMLLQREESS